MKIIYRNLTGLLFLTGLFCITLPGNSQDVKMSRQERKETKKAVQMMNFNILDSLLNVRRFVLEADYLQSKYGETVQVTSSLNFIKVDRTRGVLQTGSNSGMGYNGVGGVTAEGSIGRWEITKDAKNLSYTLRFSLSTQLGNYDVFMTVNSDNRASATISGLGPGKLTWNGHLSTLNNTSVFKGQNTI